jgi:hypothetical protein
MLVANGLRLAKGMYFVHYGRLYYVVDVEHDTNNYLIENCLTYEKTFMSGDFLENFPYVRILEVKK